MLKISCRDKLRELHQNYLKEQNETTLIKLCHCIVPTYSYYFKVLITLLLYINIQKAFETRCFYN